MTKIVFETSVWGQTQHVQVVLEEVKMMGQQGNKIENLQDEMIAQVPAHLWSQHDTDVGLVKTTTQVTIRLKPHAKPPRRPQYPLKSEAEAGVEPIIADLVTAGV